MVHTWVYLRVVDPLRRVMLLFLFPFHCWPAVQHCAEVDHTLGYSPMVPLFPDIPENPGRTNGAHL